MKAEGSLDHAKASARAAYRQPLKAAAPDRATSFPTRKASRYRQCYARKKAWRSACRPGRVAGAIRLAAANLGPGKTIVTMLCDPATFDTSRGCSNPEFLRY